MMGLSNQYEKNINNLGYRNSCKLPLRVIQGKLVSGMYKKNSNDFVAIDHCLIHSKYIETRSKTNLRSNQ